VLRHEFRPGKLVAGFFLTVAGIAYAGDAGDAWDTPWFAVIPMVAGGLCLAGAVGLLARAVRNRRDSRKRHDSHDTGTPPEVDPTSQPPVSH
jgi:drug/metabolite transporter (DMT)-like permease